MLDGRDRDAAALAAHGLAVNQDGAAPLGLRTGGAAAISARGARAGLAGTRRDSAALVARLEADAKYAVYLDRQAEDVARYRRDEALALPDDLDYAAPFGPVERDAAEVLAVRPTSLGQAGRIEGVTPAALALVAAHARRAARDQARPGT